ncbi:MAG: L-serine ammonia-lyase, iron-sulfur-dependent, subunit alpha [Candidatus Omnitrophota bacterium]|nr:hypothetical protein [Candidatus Omnitrophota bacterium]MBU2527980.1 L-serine ammonia-lyase, iron-sulfur-dependent, subunit alpha [bacterium]MBU3930125.1 L-serine ammonia-lyase, iron-sulfur-dependent, subunit alpha [bacterium]MBU4122861.1 L-serine ammonia-lyase, iron-sulfur-dependent, subunit alpha [bacterium]
MKNLKVLEELLESEIKEVVGCTEPASVAFAFARAAALFREYDSPSGISGNFKAAVVISRDVFRNISTVRVPVMKIKGINAAAACGIYTKSSGFNPFAGIGAVEKRKITALLKRKNWLKVSVKNVDGIFVDAQIACKGKKSRVVVEGSHDNVKAVYFSGRKTAQNKKKPVYRLKSMEEIFNIVKRRDKGLEDIVERFIIDQGRLYEEFGYGDVFAAVSGLVKKRMDGDSLKVITVTGSGNQGIFLGIPFYIMYKKRGKKILPAALFAVLTQIYLTNSKGRISGDCGLAGKAASSLAAGLSLLETANLKKIRDNMLLTHRALKGLQCEGAEPVCAMKAYLALTSVKNVVWPEKLI